MSSSDLPKKPVYICNIYSETMMISYSCIRGFMPNLHKKSWTDPNDEQAALAEKNRHFILGTHTFTSLFVKEWSQVHSGNLLVPMWIWMWSFQAFLSLLSPCRGLNGAGGASWNWCHQNWHHLPVSHNFEFHVLTFLGWIFGCFFCFFMFKVC